MIAGRILIAAPYRLKTAEQYIHGKLITGQGRSKHTQKSEVMVLSRQTFPPSIQHEVDLNIAAIARLQAQWPEIIALCAESSPSVYNCYPHLFLGAFPTLCVTDIRSLAVVGRLLASSVILTDALIDEHTLSGVPVSLLTVQAMQLEAYQLLHRLFPPEARFWSRLQSYVIQHTETCIQEQRFVTGTRGLDECTEAVAMEIAIGKGCMAHSMIAGLVELTQDDRLLGPLVESVNNYNIARQMIDDLCDWKEDVRDGMPSLLLARVLKGQPGQEGAATLDLNAVARALYANGHAQYVMHVALEALDQAEHVIADLPDMVWRSLIADLRARCQSLLTDIDSIMAKRLARVNSL